MSDDDARSAHSFSTFDAVDAKIIELINLKKDFEEVSIFIKLALLGKGKDLAKLDAVRSFNKSFFLWEGEEQTKYCFAYDSADELLDQRENFELFETKSVLENGELNSKRAYVLADDKKVKRSTFLLVTHRLQDSLSCKIKRLRSMAASLESDFASTFDVEKSTLVEIEESAKKMEEIQILMDSVCFDKNGEIVNQDCYDRLCSLVNSCFPFHISFQYKLTNELYHFLTSSSEKAPQVFALLPPEYSEVVNVSQLAHIDDRIKKSKRVLLVEDKPIILCKTTLLPKIKKGIEQYANAIRESCESGGSYPKTGLRNIILPRRKTSLIFKEG